ncbi:MAG: PAS domain S-box protein [bacterium]
MDDQNKVTETLRESEQKYRLLFEKMMNGVALHEIVLDQKGMPIDYVFLEVNSAFEHLTGLKRKNLIGKKVTETIPGIEKDPADWIGKYGKVALTDQEIRFEQYSLSLAKWYSVLAFSPRKGLFATIFEDITERKRTEEEIAKTKIFLDRSLTSAPDGVFLIDKEGIFTCVNQAFLKMIGYEEKDIVGKTIQEIVPKIVPPGSAKIIQQRAKKRLETGEPIIGAEVELLNKKGTTIPVAYSASGIKDEQGNVIGEVVFLRDIAERKKWAGALRESEIKYKTLWESSLDGILFTDMDGNIVDVNDSLCNMLGFTKTEFMQLSYQALTPPEWTKSDKAQVEQLIAQGYTKNHEKEYLRKDGTRIPIEISAWLTKNKEGKTIGMWGIVRDITERKQLAEKKEQILTLSHDLICIAGMDGFFKYLNPAWERTLGYTTEELLSRPFLDFIHPDDHNINDAEVEKLSKGEPSIGFENRYIHKDGSIRTISWTATPFEKEKLIYCIGRDLTERKEAEENLKVLNNHLRHRTSELERSNKELEQFAYVASHDLQEPLRMVASYTQLLEQRYKDQLDEDARDFINFAVDGANRMQRLISDLLAYSRLGTRRKLFESTDCHTVLGQALANLNMAIQKNHALVTNDDLPTVMADKLQIVQLFQNLISNAIKFHSDEQPRIHISVEEKVDEWIFSIRDNGIGIESEFKDRIFVIFQRLHTRDKYPGTGMGLAICRKIVERHGGRIWFDSALSKGSTFFFSIPKKEE